MLLPLQLNGLNLDTGTAVASISGTLVGATENQVVTGGLTTIITLTNDTWIADITAQRQAIIDGVTSAQTETLGWNNEVRDNEAVTSVVRTSDTVVTITWTAAAAYVITADEVITVTVPGAALDGGSPLTGTPTLTISDTGKVVKGRFRRRRRYLIEIDGEFFDVRNQFEAQAIFDQIREIANQQVETDVAIKPPRITVKTGTGKLTRSSGILSAVRETKQAVAQAIDRQQALFTERLKIDKEIRQLMVGKLTQEEAEEEVKLILLL